MDNYIDKFVNKNGVEIPIRTKVDNSTIKYNSSGELSAITSRTFLKDKRVCFIGDSITDSTTYPQTFCDITGAEMYNKGRSGNFIGRAASYEMCERIQYPKQDTSPNNSLIGLPTKPHLFIVYGGINDFGGNTPFGTIGEITTSKTHTTTNGGGSYVDYDVPNTFCGGVEFLFNYLKTNYPNVPIIALSLHYVHYKANVYKSAAANFSAWNTYSTYDYDNGTFTPRINSANKTWKEYKDAYETIVKSKDIPIIHLDELPFSPFGLEAPIYYKDGLHFSDLGGRIVGKYVADEIAKIMPKLPIYEGE